MKLISLPQNVMTLLNILDIHIHVQSLFYSNYLHQLPETMSSNLITWYVTKYFLLLVLNFPLFNFIPVPLFLGYETGRTEDPDLPSLYHFIYLCPLFFASFLRWTILVFSVSLYKRFFHAFDRSHDLSLNPPSSVISFFKWVPTTAKSITDEAVSLIYIKAL